MLQTLFHLSNRPCLVLGTLKFLTPWIGVGAKTCLDVQRLRSLEVTVGTVIETALICVAAVFGWQLMEKLCRIVCPSPGEICLQEGTAEVCGLHVKSLLRTNVAWQSCDGLAISPPDAAR